MIRRYLWLGLFAVAVVAGAIVLIVFRKKPSVDALGAMTKIKTELAGIRAEGEMERRAAEHGAAAALAEANLAYERRKAELLQHEQKEAEELRDDPVALAGMLARAGARRRLRS